MLRAYEGWLLGALALVMIGWLALSLLRRRRKAPARLAPPVHPLEPAEAGTAAPPPRIDLQLEIVGATRSVMMLTLDLRLAFANRSPGAVRSIALAGRLDTAQAGSDSGVSAGEAQPLGEIARIGPHQRAHIACRLQMRASDIRLIRQGTQPAFIPLVHFTYQADNLPKTTRSFVIGTPSASGSGRIQPIPFGNDMGGIHGLSAQEIRIPALPA